MSAYSVATQQILALIWVVVDSYLLGLWIYAIRRTGLPFFWIFVVGGIFAWSHAVVSLVLAYSLTQLGPFYSFCEDHYVFPAWVQPLNVLFGAIGHTMLVRWILRSKASARLPHEV